MNSSDTSTALDSATREKTFQVRLNPGLPGFAGTWEFSDAALTRHIGAVIHEFRGEIAHAAITHNEPGLLTDIADILRYAAYVVTEAPPMDQYHNTEALHGVAAIVEHVDPQDMLGHICSMIYDLRDHLKAEAARLRRLTAQYRLAELLVLCEEILHRDRTVATDHDDLPDNTRTPIKQWAWDIGVQLANAQFRAL